MSSQLPLLRLRTRPVGDALIFAFDCPQEVSFPSLNNAMEAIGIPLSKQSVLSARSRSSDCRINTRCVRLHPRVMRDFTVVERDFALNPVARARQNLAAVLPMKEQMRSPFNFRPFLRTRELTIELLHAADSDKVLF